MFDQFLTSKINSMFDRFIEDKPGETNIRKWEGIIEMHDLKLKKTLVDLLCPLLGMPMTFIGGRVAKLTVQIPWSKLLTDETKVVVEGISILCHTSNSFNPEYFQDNRRRYIDKYIRTYLDHNNELESRKNKYMERVQDFIFGRISLEVRNVHLCMENSLERHFVAGLVCQRATIRNFYTKDQHKASLKLEGIGAYLNLRPSGFAAKPADRLAEFLKRANDESQRRYVVSPTQITYERIHLKNRCEVQNNLSFQPIQVQINNVTADMLRLLVRLIEWHSCCNRTANLREPFSRDNKRASRLWKYMTQVVLNQYRASRERRRFQHLARRRKYIQHYQLIYKGRYFINKLGPNNTFLKLSEYNDLTDRLKEMEDQLELFEIIEYRKIAELLIRKNREIESCFETIRKKEYSWFTAIFESKGDATSLKMLEEQAKELATLDTVKVWSFKFTIERLRVGVVVRIEQHEDPFMDVTVDKICFRRLTERDEQKKTLEIEDCEVRYAEYLGCYKGYRKLFERAQHKAEDDEFEDFKKSIVFVQQRIGSERTNTDIRVEPIRVTVNDETMDKMMLFKEVHNRTTSQPSFQLNREISYQQAKQDLSMNTTTSAQISLSLEIVVPESLYEPSTEIIVNLGGCQVDIATESLSTPTFRVDVGVDTISCRMKYTDRETKAVMLQYLYERMNLRSEATLTGNDDDKSLQAKVCVSLSEVSLKCTNRQLQSLLYLAKRFSRFFSPKSKSKIVSRRKPSLGQEFLDAVDNLNDHVYKGSISNSNVKRSRSMLNLQDASNKIMLLMHTVSFDFSCPAVRVGYYLADKLHNSASANTLSLLLNQNKDTLHLQTFVNEIEVVVRQYIFFGDSLKKIQVFVDSNRTSDEVPASKAKDSEVSNIDMSLKASLYALNVRLFAKDIPLFVLKTEVNVEGKNLKRRNRQLKCALKLHMETSYVDRKNERKYLDVLQPFRVNVGFDQIEQRINGNAQVGEVVLNLTGELVAAAAVLASNVIGELRSYRIVNLLNLPVHVKGRAHGFVEVPSGKELTIKIAHNYVLQYIVQSLKYTETGEDRCQSFIAGSNIRLIRELTATKDGTTVTFKSNIRFLNESANSIGLTILRKQIVRDEEDEGYVRGSKRASFNVIRSKQEVYILGEDVRELEFDVKLDQELGEQCQPLSLAAFLRESSQRLLAIADTFLVLYPKVATRPPNSEGKQLIDFDLHICCPLEVSNYLPGPISLRFLKEELVDDRPWTETSSSKYRARSKSVEMLALQKVNPLDCYSLSSASLEDINEIYVQFGMHCKTFKLDLQYEMLEQQEAWDRRKDKAHKPSEQFEIVKVVTLTNAGIDQRNIVCRITVRRHSIRLFFMSDVIIFNLLDFSLSLRIKEQGYFYNEMTASSAPPYRLENYLLSDRSYNHKDMLKSLFEESRDNLILFTGDSQCANRLFFFNDNEVGYDDGFRDPIIHIDREGRNAIAVIRRIQLDFGLILIFISPVCTLINRSTSSIFVASGDLSEKTVRPNEKEPVTTFYGESVRIGIRGASEHTKNTEFHLDTNILGIVYFRREMRPGQYRFFRVLTSKSDYQTNILVQDSEYPPITFINRLKEKIRISEMGLERGADQPEDLSENQTLQYSLINPYKPTSFRISIYNYECTTLKDNLQFVHQAQIFECYDKRTKRKIYISTETFKDQRVVLISYSRELSEQVQKAFHSGREPLLRLTFTIKEVGVSLLTASYRQYGYLQYESVVLDYKKKERHSSFYFQIRDTNLFSYSDLEPRLLLSINHEHNLLQSIRSKVGRPLPVKNFAEVRVKYNMASNVRVIKFMQVQLLPVVVHLDAKFAIDFLQNSLPVVPNLRKLGQSIGGRLLAGKQDQALGRAQNFYIVEHMKLGNTNMELWFDNLEILKDIYEGSTVYNLIISFLDNMGRLKPVTIDDLELRYENVSVEMLLKLFNMRGHVKQIFGQIMLRPAKQIHAAAMTLLGFTSGISSDSSLISSSISTSLYVVKSLLKNFLRGQQLDMKELEADNSDVVAKLCSLKCWKGQRYTKRFYQRVGRYDNQQPFKFETGAARHERYTFQELRPHDQDFSLAKYILAQRNRQKTVQRINSLYRLSTKCFMFLTDNTSVLVEEADSLAYFWSPEQILSIELQEDEVRVRFQVDTLPQCLKAIQVETVSIKAPTIGQPQLDHLNSELKDFREEDAFYLC